MGADKSGTPPCGIYVRIDDFSDMQKLLTGLRQMALTINRASGYEKNMHVVEFVYSFENAEKISDLVAVMQAEGLVTVLSHMLAHRDDFLGCDGVLLSETASFTKMRTIMAEDGIIGLVCGGSRAKAQEALTLEADYVALGPDTGLVSWWSMQTDKPCVVFGGLTNDNCGAFVRAGATFIEATDYIFGHEKGVMQGTVNMLHAIDLAAGMPERLN